MTFAQTAGDPIALLWKIARVWLADAIAAFGAPAEIATLLARGAQNALRRRLKALEALAMKLLLAEAARIRRVTHTQSTPSAMSCATIGSACVSPRASGNRRCEVDPADPETWRVRFALRIPPETAPQSREASGPRIRDIGPRRLVTQVLADMAARARIARMAALRTARALKPQSERARAKALKLARRFEALRRMLENPVPHVRRLAHMLGAMRERAFAAARRIAMLRPPRGETNPVVHDHASVEVWRVIPSAFPADTS
jgi:hypothetical protein